MLHESNTSANHCIKLINSASYERTYRKKSLILRGFKSMEPTVVRLLADKIWQWARKSGTLLLQKD